MSRQYKRKPNKYDRENTFLNNEVFTYCYRVFKLRGHPPYDKELDGYIRFKKPDIKDMAMKAKIDYIKRSPAYRSMCQAG